MLFRSIGATRWVSARLHAKLYHPLSGIVCAWAWLSNRAMVTFGLRAGPHYVLHNQNDALACSHMSAVPATTC